jgi:hypothetical protein
MATGRAVRHLHRRSDGEDRFISTQDQLRDPRRDAAFCGEPPDELDPAQSVVIGQLTTMILLPVIELSRSMKLLSIRTCRH